MSYIRIVCAEDADPKYNRIQLRTDAPTYIELQPGENILSVEDYPELKYGFSQIKDFGFENAPEVFANASPYEYNGGGIIEVDFSHFDAAEMTSMDNMFSHMVALKRIVFGDEQILYPTSAKSTFDRIGDEMDVLDLTSIDFSGLKDASYMLYGVSANTLDLYGVDFSGIEVADEMFTSLESKNIILDHARGLTEIVDLFPFEDGFIESISLKCCRREAIESFAIAISKSGREIHIDIGKSWNCKVLDGKCIIQKKAKYINLHNSMEQKLINLSVETPSGFECDEITSNPKLQELIADGWKIEHFSVMPHYINPSQKGFTDMVLLTILLSR